MLTTTGPARFASGHIVSITGSANQPYILADVRPCNVCWLFIFERRITAYMVCYSVFSNMFIMVTSCVAFSCTLSVKAGSGNHFTDFHTGIEIYC